LDWLQILLSLILGFLFGLAVTKRKYKMVTIEPVKRCEHQNDKNLQLENNTID